MAQTVSISQAAQNALKAWVATQMTDCVVDTRVPEATTTLPAKAITIVRAGPRRDVLLEPVPYNFSVIDSTRGSYAWRMRACEQPLQLDVWAVYDVDRDDIMNRLDAVLNAGFALTLPGAGITSADPWRHGVALQLLQNDGYSAIADFSFDESDPIDTPRSVQETEYRATYRGVAVIDLFLTSVSVRSLGIKLKQMVSEQKPPPANWVNDIWTVAATNNGKYVETFGP